MPTRTRRIDRKTVTEEYIAELKSIAFADPRLLYEKDGRGKRIQDVPDDLKAALASVKLDKEGRIRGFRFKDKLTAIRKLGNMLGMFDSHRRKKR